MMQLASTRRLLETNRRCCDVIGCSDCDCLLYRANLQSRVRDTAARSAPPQREHSTTYRAAAAHVADRSFPTRRRRL